MTKTEITFCTSPRLEMRIMVPETPREQSRGLQGFTIKEREGMLFLSEKWPEEQIISMWQATVGYPLAMIWIGIDNRVHAIEMVEPGDKRTFSHRGVAVVEVNAYVASKYNIIKGTSVADGRVSC